MIAEPTLNTLCSDAEAIHASEKGYRGGATLGGLDSTLDRFTPSGCCSETATLCVIAKVRGGFYPGCMSPLCGRPLQGALNPRLIYRLGVNYRPICKHIAL